MTKPLWFIRSGCGSKLRGTCTCARFESRSRMFVIEDVHIQCSKLFKGLECVVLSTVLCHIKNNSMRVGYSPGFGLPFVTIITWVCRKRLTPIILHIDQLHLAQQLQSLTQCWFKVGTTLSERLVIAGMFHHAGGPIITLSERLVFAGMSQHAGGPTSRHACWRTMSRFKWTPSSV